MGGLLLFAEAGDAQLRRAMHQDAAVHECVELVLADERSGPTRHQTDTRWG